MDSRRNVDFILQCQAPLLGGFSKVPDARPDPLHTYFGIAGLSLMNHQGTQPMEASLNLSKTAHKRLKLIQQKWRSGESAEANM